MKIDSTTRLYAVIGNPVSHSMSPVMHNSAFHHSGYNAIYTAFKVKDIAGAVSGIRALGIQGISVTIPHKIEVMAYLDEIDDGAKKIGAVNTICLRQGKLFGYNTDGQGAVEALAEKTSIRGREIGIIGAGGAARAIGFEAVSGGAFVTIFNRSRSKGEGLADDLGGVYRPLSELKQAQPHILINTTPVGMSPEIEETPVEKTVFEKKMIVMDIVYNPLITRFLKEAKAMGSTIVDGLSMFVYQGALQFEIWTGKKAPVDVMRKAVLEGLKK